LTMLLKFSRGSVRLCRNDGRHCCCISAHGKLGIEDKSSRHSGELRCRAISVIPRGPTHSMPVISWSAHASSCLEGEAMTRKTWGLVIASVLVSSILLEGPVFATDAGAHKKIVMVSNSTDFVLLQGVLNPLQGVLKPLNAMINGITVVHPLPMIHAFAVE